VRGSTRPRHGQYLRLICKRCLPPENSGAAARTAGSSAELG